jgi:hypothetical protein
MAWLWAVAILCLVLVMMVAAYWTGWLLNPDAAHVRDEWAVRIRKRLGREWIEPEVRPIEVLAAEMHRLGCRFHTLPAHASFAKQTAIRTAYDHVLAECCTALGREHLLDVLPPGQELDDERRRVELMLYGLGMPLADAA